MVCRLVRSSGAPFADPAVDDNGKRRSALKRRVPSGGDSTRRRLQQEALALPAATHAHVVERRAADLASTR